MRRCHPICPWVFLLARRKVETDLAHVIDYQISGKGPARFGNKLIEQIAPAFREQLDDLARLDRLLQNCFADLKFAGALVRLGLLTNIACLRVKHASAAFGAFAQRLLSSEIDFLGWGLRLGALRGTRAGFRFARLEFKSDFAFLERKERFKRPAFLRDKLVEQIRFAGLEQFLHLGALDRPLQNDFAGPEIARAIGAGRLFADILHCCLKNAITALGTFANWILSGEIDRLSRSIRIGLILPEVELGLQFGSQLDDGGKWPARFAAESLQRPDLALLNQLLDFGNLELSAGDNFPQAKIALLALELFIIFMDLAAALRTWGFERSEIARDGIAFVTLGFIHDSARHVRDFFHEIGALHLPPRHAAQLEFPVAG